MIHLIYKIILVILASVAGLALLGAWAFAWKMEYDHQKRVYREFMKFRER